MDKERTSLNRLRMILNRTAYLNVGKLQTWYESMLVASTPQGEQKGFRVKWVNCKYGMNPCWWRALNEESRRPSGAFASSLSDLCD